MGLYIGYAGNELRLSNRRALFLVYFFFARRGRGCTKARGSGSMLYRFKDAGTIWNQVGVSSFSWGVNRTGRGQFSNGGTISKETMSRRSVYNPLFPPIFTQIQSRQNTVFFNGPAVCDSSKTTRVGAWEQASGCCMVTPGRSQTATRAGRCNTANGRYYAIHLTALWLDGKCPLF